MDRPKEIPTIKSGVHLVNVGRARIFFSSTRKRSVIMISSVLFSKPHRRSVRAAGLRKIGVSLALAAVSVTAVAQYASGSTTIDATGDPHSERAACMTGKTQQVRKTCLTEVLNASAAKRSGRLENYGEQFAANALKRCDVFSGDDLSACKVRVQGQGRIEGSVAEGGLLREAETVVSSSGGNRAPGDPAGPGTGAPPTGLPQWPDPALASICCACRDELSQPSLGWRRLGCDGF
jgi:hypothetical protein